MKKVIRKLLSFLLFLFIAFPSYAQGIPDQRFLLERYFNNSKGLDDTNDFLVVKPGFATLSTNITYSNRDGRRSLKSRGGSALSFTGHTTLSSTITGLHQIIDKAEANNYLLVVTADGTLRAMDDLDGTFDDITGSIVVSSNQVISIDINDTWIATDGENPLWKWAVDDAGTTTATLLDVSSLFTSAKALGIFGEYVFVGNTVESSARHRNRLRFSLIGDPDSWVTDDFIDLGLDDHDRIMVMATLRHEMYVFKERSIWRVSRGGDAFIPFQVTKVAQDIGCSAPHALVQHNDFIMFVDEDRIYKYDGQQLVDVSIPIINTLRSSNSSRSNKIVGGKMREERQAWFAYTSSGGSVNDRVIVYDYNIGAWTLYTGLEVNAAVTYESGGFPLLFTGGSDGLVLKQNSGTDDNGVDISAVWESKWHDLNIPEWNKSYVGLYIFAEKANGNLFVSTATDFQDFEYEEQVSQVGSDFILSPATPPATDGILGVTRLGGPETQVARIHLGEEGNFFKVKFSNKNSETIQVYGYTIEYQPIAPMGGRFE